MVDSSFFSGGGYAYPDFYAYPPYFTLQPVKETREKQMSCWRDLVVSFTRANRDFEFETKTFELFENKSINRSLNESARKAIVDDLCAHGLGETCEGSGGGTVRVLWRSLQEWQSCVLDWAHRTGRRGDVLTVEELCDSSEVAGEEFRGMPPSMMERILRTLEKQKKVMIFQGTDQDDLGVKFL